MRTRILAGTLLSFIWTAMAAAQAPAAPDQRRA